jgi:hypothetical protein
MRRAVAYLTCGLACASVTACADAHGARAGREVDTPAQERDAGLDAEASQDEAAQHRCFVHDDCNEEFEYTCE